MHTHTRTRVHTRAALVVPQQLLLHPPPAYLEEAGGHGPPRHAIAGGKVPHHRAGRRRCALWGKESSALRPPPGSAPTPPHGAATCPPAALGGGCGGAAIVPPVNSGGAIPSAPTPQPPHVPNRRRGCGVSVRAGGQCGESGGDAHPWAATGLRGAAGGPGPSLLPAPLRGELLSGEECAAFPLGPALSLPQLDSIWRGGGGGERGGRVGGRRCPLLRGDGGGSAGPPPPGGDPGERGELCPQRRSARQCGEGGPRPHHGDTPGGSAAHGRHGDGAAPHAVLRPRLTAGIRRGRTAHSAQHTAHSTRRTAHGPRHPTHPRRARRIHAAPLWVTGAVGALRRPTARTRTKAAGAGGLRGPPPHLSAAGSGPGPAELTLQPCTNHLQDNGESVQAAKTNSAGGQAARHPTAPPRPPQRRSPAHSSR